MQESRKKILFLISELNHGGVQIETLHIIKSIVNQNYDIYYFAGMNGALFNEFNSVKSATGKICSYKKNGYSIIEVIELYKFIKNNNINFIVSFSVKYSLLLSFIKLFLQNIKIIYRHSGIIFNSKMPIYKFYINQIVEYLNILSSNQVIAVCPSNASKLIYFYPSQKSKIEWVSTYYNKINFINRNKLNDRCKILQKYNLANDTFLVCCPQSFAQGKNQIELVKIFFSFTKIVNNSFLIFCGDGQLLNQVRNFVDQNTLNSKVAFTGAISNVYEFISGCNVVCSTSFYMEGLPQICSQSNYCLTPMVFYDWEGVSDELVDGENGFLVKQDDFTDFVNKLFLVYSNKINHNFNFSLPHNDEIVEKLKGIFKTN